MKSRCKSKAPPGGIFRWWPGIVLALTLLPLVTARAQQDMEGQGMTRPELAKTTDLPDWRLILWDTVVRPDLSYFSWCSAPLGDINGDGYDDLAVSSSADTTYIFLGGDPFSHDYAFIVRGGSSWITSADFNRDGKMDLVTAIQNRPPGEAYMEQRGAIRIYLQKDGPIPFVWEPDLLIEGDVNERLGVNFEHRGAIAALDYNGDGWPDLLARSADSRDSVEWKGVLFLGGPDMDARPDAEFRVGTPRNISQLYLVDLLIGDINGDGCDDMLIHDQYGVNNVPVYYWDLYLGNAWGQAGIPNRVLQSDIGWSPARRIAGIMDIDADGYDDIIDAGPNSLHRILGDALFFRGKPNLPPVLFPDDS
ncbi:MAG: VCBS repeat-containing protein, partial [Bacteroidota bacterium]|nr:VCBS repeat-containing protein [Bacteroidota bacterium]